METSEKKPPEHLSIDRPSGWISQFAPLIPEGEVLDLACGAGRHSRFLAGMGYALLAVDRSADSLALAAGQGITTLQVDLESGEAESTWPFAHNRFAGIVVTNYLYRPLFDALVGSLAPNGVLLYETFALGNEQFGKPSNPDFLLAHGELLQLAGKHGLQVVAYEDGYVDQPKPAMVQRICAIKPGKPPAAENLRLM